MLEVRVLGSVGARDGRVELDVGGPTAATVLGVLAANAPAVVSSSRLSEAIWEDDPPRSAHRTLQAHVSRVRRALAGDGGLRPGLVVASGDGYGLDPEAVTTDLSRFRSLADQARDAGQWLAALAVWRGEPLQGCVDTRLVEAERTGLRAEHLSAVESWASASLSEGCPEPVVAELERLVVVHPLHEHLWALLVQAQAAIGRRRDALVTYQRARDELAERAGLEPGPRLRAAEAAVLSEGHPAPRADHGGGDRVAVPARRSSIVGRTGDENQIRAMLDDGRLVTVTGPGGCGKTTVANEVARQITGDLEGGAVFVDLVPATDAAGVTRSLAAAWGIRQLGDDQDVASVIAGRVAGRRTLLILDNCEHVADAVAGVVDRLLDLAEPLTVLATSRAPLALSGEAVWSLAALPVDEAVELFFERLPPAIAPGADREAVAELCGMLDGLPLAVELAAARTGQLSVTEMVEGLAGRPDLLRTHRRTEGRHGSLAAAIGWSYDLLEPVEQACLRRIAVFRGAFDIERAAAVVAGVADARDAATVVGDLAAKSLVVADTSGGHTRFRLLDMIRTFAWDQAARSGDAEDAAVRHRDWYLAWADRVPAASNCLRLSGAYLLVAHHSDLLDALETSRRRGDHEALGRLAVFASGLLFCPGGRSDADRWITEALEHAEDLPEPLVADLLGTGTLTSLMAVQLDVGGERLFAAADLAVRHRSGAAPLALCLGLCDPGVTPFILDRLEAVLEHPAELQDDVNLAIVGMHPFWTFASVGAEQALTEAEAVWADEAWSDDRTMSTWALHAALLYMAGQHERLAQRLAEADRGPPTGPPGPFLSLFEALVLAGTGAAQQALDRLRDVRRQHWLRLPGIENDFVVAVAAIADMTGDRRRARRLLDRPDLWSRHPSTVLVQLHHRRRLELPPPPSLGTIDHAAVSALLDEELGR